MGGGFYFTPYVISQAASTAVTEYVLQIVFKLENIAKDLERKHFTVHEMKYLDHKTTVYYLKCTLAKC